MLKSFAVASLIVFGGALLTILWWVFLDWLTGAYKRGWWWSRW